MSVVDCDDWTGPVRSDKRPYIVLDQGLGLTLESRPTWLLKRSETRVPPDWSSRTLASNHGGDHL